jgi:hypothetical protein
MTKLWAIAPSDKSLTLFLSLTNARPPKLFLLNDAEIAETYQPAASEFERSFGTAHFEDAPVPQLKIEAPTFQASWFQLGDIYVSEDLRDAMDLPKKTAQYWPVDTRECSDSVRSKKYMRLQPLHAAEALDTENSTGFWLDTPHSLGNGRAWMPGNKDEMLGLKPRNFSRIPVIAYKKDLQPPASLFYCPLLHQVLVTDALAKKIMDHGIEDVIFIDNSNDGTENEIKLRTR